MHDVNASRAANAFVPLTASAVLVNAVGLHARPSVKLTQCAKGFAAKIEFALAPDGPWTDAKSPVKVMRVKAPQGATLHFRVSGPDPVKTRQYAQSFAQVLGRNANTRNINYDWNEPAKVVKVDVDQDRARALGISSVTASQT